MHLFRVLVTSLLLALSTLPVHALSYRVAQLDNGCCAPRQDCATVFVATGEIERSELQSFRKFVGGLNQRSAGPRAFVIDSEGGNLAGAFGMGLVLQRIGIPVIVGSYKDGKLGPGFCGSACVFVLMGGRSRQVAPGSVVAVHAPQRVPAQAEHGGEELSAADAKNSGQIAKVLTNYARRTGVDPALIMLTMSVPPHERRPLTPDELRRFRLVVVAK